MPPDTTGENDSRLGLAWDILARALGFGYRPPGPWRPRGRSSYTGRPQAPRPGQRVATEFPICRRRIVYYAADGDERWWAACSTPLVNGRCPLHGEHTTEPTG